MLRTGHGAEIVIADAAPGRAFAVIRPQAVTVRGVRRVSRASATRWPGTVNDVDRLGDRVRIGIDGPLPLTAEITAAALAALDLRPGDQVHASVKATDIVTYPE